MGAERWLAELKAALRRNRCRWVQLATTSPEGLPEVRMLVLRRLDAEGRMTILTDARSAKVPSLEAAPHAEALFWSRKTKEQFRVFGSVQFEAEESPGRKELWARLPKAHRAPFFGPPPGAALGGSLDPGSRSDIPDSFRVFVLTPERVDLLAIGRTPQTRRRFELRGHEWSATDVVP